MQQKNEEHAFQSAFNRVNNAIKLKPEADYCIGLESGIDMFHKEMIAYDWVVIKEKNGIYGKGKTSVFFLSPAVNEVIKQGKTLAEADDSVFSRKNSNKENGTVGLLTDNAVTRTTYYIDAVVMALLPLKNPKLY